MCKSTQRTLIVLALIAAAVYLMTHRLGDDAWFLLIFLLFWD